jgi:carbonic anhydrase
MLNGSHLCCEDRMKHSESRVAPRKAARGRTTRISKRFKDDRYLRLRVLLVALAAAAPVAAHAQWKTPWDYQGATGPEHWGELDPDYAACKTGRSQAPIDIRETSRTTLPLVQFAYHSAPLNIVNNGHTAVRVDYAPGNGEYLVVGGKRFELTQFHFHHPSEEQVHGKAFPMNIHLMHKSEDGQVIGVSVLVTVGGTNAAIDQLWKYMPKNNDGPHSIEGVEFDPSGLVPTATAYYTYDGSQTAPPCTEGVTWIVLKSPVSISAKALRQFSKLYPHDVRPPQPLNGRSVKESF